MNKSGKICFVLQQSTAGTHMDYVYEMARTLREEEKLPLTLLLEKGQCLPEHAAWCQAQTFRFAPLRVFENFFTIFWLRLSGHSVFYIHYSFLSAISAGIVTKLFGGTVYYWNCGMPWQYKRPWYVEWYQKLAFKFIDYLVTGVAALTHGYQETYGLTPEQIIIIPNWIDLSKITQDSTVRSAVRTELGLTENVPVLLYVHTLAKRKGAHLLPDILDQVSEKRTHLIVAGDGGERDNLVAEFSRRGLSDRVHMLGYVDREKVQKLYQVADIFIMPSEEEGSPHSLIEAMAYGLPFVSYDVGGVKETAPPDTMQYLHTFPNTDLFAQSVSRLLTNQELYRKFQADEHEWVKRFDKSKIITKFKKLLARQVC